MPGKPSALLPVAGGRWATLLRSKEPELPASLPDLHEASSPEAVILVLAAFFLGLIEVLVPIEMMPSSCDDVRTESCAVGGMVRSVVRHRPAGRTGRTRRRGTLADPMKD